MISLSDSDRPRKNSNIAPMPIAEIGISCRADLRNPEVQRRLRYSRKMRIPLRCSCSPDPLIFRELGGERVTLVRSDLLQHTTCELGEVTAEQIRSPGIFRPLCKRVGGTQENEAVNGHDAARQRSQDFNSFCFNAVADAFIAATLVKDDMIVATATIERLFASLSEQFNAPVFTDGMSAFIAAKSVNASLRFGMGFEPLPFCAGDPLELFAWSGSGWSSTTVEWNSDVDETARLVRRLGAPFIFVAAVTDNGLVTRWWSIPIWTDGNAITTIESSFEGNRAAELQKLGYAILKIMRACDPMILLSRDRRNQAAARFDLSGSTISW